MIGHYIKACLKIAVMNFQTRFDVIILFYGYNRGKSRFVEWQAKNQKIVKNKKEKPEERNKK